jgi:hypothetical protein
MTTDTFLAIAGVILAIGRLGVSVFAIIDNRRLRGDREKAVIAASWSHRAQLRAAYRASNHSLSLCPEPMQQSTTAFEAINQARAALDKL